MVLCSLMVGYYQSEATLPWAGKCICNYVFVISSSSYSSSSRFFFLLFQVAHHSLGPLLEERNIGWAYGWISTFVSGGCRGYMWRPAGDDGVHFLRKWYCMYGLQILWWNHVVIWKFITVEVRSLWFFSRIFFSISSWARAYWSNASK